MSSSESEVSDLEMLHLLSDSSDSDSEENNRRIRVYKQRVNYLSTLDDFEFQLRFRLDKPSVQELLLEIYPYIRITGARNHGISPIHQLLLTLRFYALGTMLISVADFIGVSKTSACRIVRDISNAIAQLYNRYIYMHTNTEQDFYSVSRFLRVLGALDGTHIRIQSPFSQIGEEFRNRKGYFSLNVQAACNANLQFMNLVARWPGSAHDATIFNSSELRAPPILTCSPSPCGPHSNCREVESQAICSCQINSMGTPPKCRPECTMNSECASDKACFNRKCVDPCVYKCARNANCTVIAHNPICSCQDRFTGDPFTKCVPMPLSIPTQRPEANPCVPSPCGPNSHCQEFDGNASCTCLPNYFSSPPRCRPECTMDSECNEDMACINNWCGDPCPVACGNYAECLVKYHVPYCTCLPDSCQALDQTFGFLHYPVRCHKYGWPYDTTPDCSVNSPQSSFKAHDCPLGFDRLNGICVEND